MRCNQWRQPEYSILEYTLRRGYRFFPERLTGAVGMWIITRKIHIDTGAKVGKSTSPCNSNYTIS